MTVQVDIRGIDQFGAGMVDAITLLIYRLLKSRSEAVRSAARAIREQFGYCQTRPVDEVEQWKSLIENLQGVPARSTRLAVMRRTAVTYAFHQLQEAIERDAKVISPRIVLAPDGNPLLDKFGHLIDTPVPGTPDHDAVRSASKIGAWAGYTYTYVDNVYICDRGLAMEPVVVDELNRRGADIIDTQRVYGRFGEDGHLTICTVDGCSGEAGGAQIWEIKTPVFARDKMTDIKPAWLLQMAVQHLITEMSVKLAVAGPSSVTVLDPAEHPLWAKALHLAGHYIEGQSCPQQLRADFADEYYAYQNPVVNQIVADGDVKAMRDYARAEVEFKKRCKAHGPGDILDSSGNTVATISDRGVFRWK